VLLHFYVPGVNILTSIVISNEMNSAMSNDTHA